MGGVHRNVVVYKGVVNTAECIAFVRSVQRAARDLCLLLASNRIVASLQWCSVHTAFWVDRLR